MDVSENASDVDGSSSLVPTSRPATKSCVVLLPVELLSLIFMMSMMGQRCVGWTPGIQIIACSHVCIFWRNVALSTPSLWCDIDLEDPSFEQFAVRSEPLPIRITAFPRRQNDLHIISRDVSWLGAHAHRVELLLLSGSDQLIKIIMPLLGFDLPRLCVFHLAVSGSVVSVDIHAPNLRALRLRNVEFDLEALSNLTSISLEHYSIDSSSRTAAQIVSLLRRCPQLRHLHIAHTMGEWEVGAGGTGGGTPVELAYLERLDISDIGMPALTHLLNHISIPASAPMLGQQRVATDDGVCKIRVSIEGSTFELLRPDTDHYFRITDDLVFFNISTALCLIGITLDMSPATDITIYIFGHADSSPDTWQHFLSGMSAINHLEISTSYGCMTNILSTIWPSNLEATLFPGLRSLSLNLEGLFPGDPEEVAIAEFVIGRLESRSRSGARLELLNIDFGSERIIERLKEVINSVVKVSPAEGTTITREVTYTTVNPTRFDNISRGFINVVNALRDFFLPNL